MSERPAGQGATWVLGWAMYLACSWTWCIGMFLPALLIRDFGAWSFAVFAIPNVLGAAAMGFVLRTSAAAQRILTDHAPAVRAFSLVTIAFQVFFLTLLLRGASPVVGICGFILGIIAAEYIPAKHSLVRWVPGLIWLISAALLTRALDGNASLPPLDGKLPVEHLLPLAAICTFGFLLCPYLDVSFLRARAALQTPSSSRLAFAFGFGLFFLAMIVGTFFYAPLFADYRGVLSPANVTPAFTLAPESLIGLHILIQLAFTIGCHAHSPRSESNSGFTSGIGGTFAIIAGVLLGLAARFYPAAVDRPGILATITEMRTFELIYRVFMSFYGLIFPVYVLFLMLPSRASRATRAAAALIAILAAAPCFWLGSIAMQTWWLLPGVGIVLLAFGILRLLPAPQTTPTPSAAA